MRFNVIDDEKYSLGMRVSPDELKQIKVFKSRAEKLLNNSLVLGGFKSSADLQINNDGPSFSFELPSEEAFESLLMRFRHFWAQKELCSFNRVRNIVHRHMPHTRERTEALKVAWKKGLFHSSHIMIDGVELTSEKLIDIWLNSEFFHNDEVKKTELDGLIERIELFHSPQLVRFLLIGSICECCNVIFELNELLEEIN